MNGAKVWVGTSLIGGSFEGAVEVGSIEYEPEENPYIFPCTKEGSSVQIQGSSFAVEPYVMLAEVEVYASATLSKLTAKLLKQIKKLFDQS